MILKEEVIDLNTSTGEMRTYIFSPVGAGHYPGIVLFSEIFQVTGPIRRVAAFLAGHGFIVAVPEIFHELEDRKGVVLAYDQAGADRGNQHKITKQLSSYDEDARVAIKQLRQLPECNGNIGTLGICIGGHLAFRCAMNSEILACVCFYATDIHKGSLGAGMQDDSLSRIPEIKGELLLFWGKQDPHIPLEGREIIHRKLMEAGTNFTWHEFNAQHAFIRDEGPRYDPVLAQQCLGMALNLFYRTL